MKNRFLSLILVLVLLLSCLAACKSGDSPSTTEGGTSAGKPAQNSNEVPAETEPDYSRFEMPEATDKLTVYANEDNLKSLLDPAIRIFRELYPDVAVDYQICGQDEYVERIRAELPAGRGPDLVLLDSGTLLDIYKTMSTGIFADLNPYFAADDEIDLADFLAPVMDGGMMHGKRFLAPISYDTPLLATTRSILEEIGMSEEAVTTCDGFIEAARRFRELHPDGDLYIDTCQVEPYYANIRALVLNFGFDLINYEKNEVEVDETLFRQCMDLVKLYDDPDYDENDMSKMYLADRTYMIGGGLALKTCLFDNVTLSLLGLEQKLYNLSERGEELILLAQTDQHDGVTAELCYNAAIPEGAANKRNAWRLLKILLSDEIQGGQDPDRFNLPYFWVGYPVRRESIKPYLSTDISLMGVSDEDTECFIAAVQSPTDALLLPKIYRQYIMDSFLPYIRGDKPWEQCWKQFMNTLELYKDE